MSLKFGFVELGFVGLRFTKTPYFKTALISSSGQF